MEDKSNKVLIVAVVCIIIGVVVGFVLMKGNMNFASQTGRTIETQENYNPCEPGQIWDNGQCLNGTVGGGNKGMDRTNKESLSPQQSEELKAIFSQLQDFTKRHNLVSPTTGGGGQLDLICFAFDDAGQGYWWNINGWISNNFPSNCTPY